MMNTPTPFYSNNNYPNNNFYMLQQQIRQVIQYLGISNNIRLLLQRGYSIQQIQQQMQGQWVSDVMNNPQVAQFIQFNRYDWNQVRGWVYQEIQRQVISINQEIMNQRMVNVTNTMIMNTNNMMRTTQNMLNNTQIQRNLQLTPTMQIPPNNINRSSNNNTNSVPKNSTNNPITAYLREIKDYVQNKMQSLLEKSDLELKDQDWETLMGIQLKLSEVLDSFEKSGDDYLKYSECIDRFFEYWRQITENQTVYESFLKYVEESLSKMDNHQLISSTQPVKGLQAKGVLAAKKFSLNNGAKTQRPKLATRYNAFVEIGDTYEKQDISGLRKYLTQLHSWIQEEYKWIENKDNKTSAEEMNLFCNVCEYYANVTKCFLNLVERDYDDIFDLNNELFKLYKGKFKEIEEKSKDSPNIKGYVARKLHWLKMNFDASSPAMLMVAKQFACYKTDSDKHISELQEQLQSFKGIKEKNPSGDLEIVTTPDTDNTDNLEISDQTGSNPYKDKLSEVVKSVNTLNADIERISVSDSAQRLIADRARNVAAASLAKVRAMCGEEIENARFNYRMQLPKSVEIRSNFFTWFGWVWYRIRRLFNGEASLATNSLTNEADQVIREQLKNVLSDDNIRLLSLGFLSQYKINAVLKQNSQWLADNVIKRYLVGAINSNDVIRGCKRKVLEAFYNIVPEAENNESFNGVKYGLLNLVSNVLGVTVNQTIFEFLTQTASEGITREDKTLDYLSTAEVANFLGRLFDDSGECKKLQSKIGKLFVDKFETNLKNEFIEVRQVIEQSRDLSEDNSRAYNCNDATISNELFNLNQKYIKDNIDSVNTGATFSNIFKHDPDFNHRNNFLSKVKFNLKGYGPSELQYLNSLQESFLSNLSLDHESQCRKELGDIQMKKQARKSVEQKKQNDNENDENNINNNPDDDVIHEEEEKNENTKVTLNKIDIDKFVQGCQSFYCSKPLEILEENEENKEKVEPTSNYPNYNEFELSKPGLKPELKPGLIDDRDLNDDSCSAPAITAFGGQIDASDEVEESNLETPIASDGSQMFTNNPVPAISVVDKPEVDNPNELFIDNQGEENQLENENNENVENTIVTNNQEPEPELEGLNGPKPKITSENNKENGFTNDPDENPYK